jgi:hypothetical protein
MIFGNPDYKFSDFLRLLRLNELAESEENQFTPLGAGVNKLIFKRFWVLKSALSIVI